MCAYSWVELSRTSWKQKQQQKRKEKEEKKKKKELNESFYF